MLCFHHIKPLNTSYCYAISYSYTFIIYLYYITLYCISLYTVLLLYTLTQYTFITQSL